MGWYLHACYRVILAFNNISYLISSNSCFVEIELTDIQKELRALIQKQMDEEVQKLMTTMNEQMKSTDEVLQKKLTVAETGSARGSSKGGQRKKK